MFSPDTKILIVDDMRTMRMVVKKNLTSLGFTNVTEADDGETAWSAVEQSVSAMSPFKLIISDWTMPKMSGLDFLKKVRSHPSMGKTPFLMITAESDAALVKEAITAGVSNYVTKPFSAETLQQKLQAVFDRFQKSAG